VCSARALVVVGHSWGTLVALALAIRHPADTAGLVLLSGYYFPTFRLDALMVAPGAKPFGPGFRDARPIETAGRRLRFGARRS
jgi:pimeloyl-ACP methyl ester carboxylesterase